MKGQKKQISNIKVQQNKLLHSSHIWFIYDSYFNSYVIYEFTYGITNTLHDIWVHIWLYNFSFIYIIHDSYMIHNRSVMSYMSSYMIILLQLCHIWFIHDSQPISYVIYEFIYDHTSSIMSYMIHMIHKPISYGIFIYDHTMSHSVTS